MKTRDLSNFNPIEYPTIFTSPLRIAPSTWSTHIPFGKFLIDLLRPETIVELGTYYGVSYCAFCQAIHELGINTQAFAVDTWRGDKHGGYFGDEVLEDLRKHHDPLYGSFSRLIQNTFDEAVGQFQDGSIDLLHIDGLHTYEAVKHDFDTWLPRISKKGVVLFHDISVRTGDFGVWRLWEELSAKYPSFFMVHGHGLGVLAVGEDFPSQLQLLFELSQDELEKFREFFSQLGKEVELHIENTLQIKALMTEINEQKSRLQTFQTTLSEHEEAINGLANCLSIIEVQKTTFTSQIIERDERIDTLTSQITEQNERINAANAQLNEIYISKAWKVALLLRNIRVFLYPPGGVINQIINGIRKSIAIISSQGFKYFLNRLINKVSPVNHVYSSVPFDNEFIETKVSIILPIYNALHLTKNCIEKLYKVPNDIEFELIVIDNHSTDETENYIKREQNIRHSLSYYRMETNLGFAGAVNFGILQAKGSVIVILNNDTLVTPYWLDHLLHPFKQNDMIGIISPVTNYVGEGPQIDLEASNITPSEIDDYANKIKNREWIFEPNRLVFFCVAIKREVIDTIGVLDIGYEKGNYEDDDYCLRTILSGFRLAIAKNSFVYHFGSATFTENKISHSGFMEKNRRRFYRKVQNISIVKKPLKQKCNDPVVSLIVRTKNRPQLLRKALLSLSNQTNNQFETIIINDGGEDVSNLVHEFHNYYPITYIRNVYSKGRSDALNIGIDRCRGEWIGILDDDDILYPWHIDNLLTAAINHPKEKFFYSNYNQSLFQNSATDYSLKIVGVEPWEYDQGELMVNNHIPIHSWLISKKCFYNIGNFNSELTMLEDFDFLIRLSKTYGFHHVNRVTCEYRFYLDGVNSIVSNRLKTKEALLSIYEAHKTDDEFINKRRDEVIVLFDKQLRAINNVKLSTHPDALSETSNGYRKIMNIVTGL